jgi:hypothetical protein
MVTESPGDVEIDLDAAEKEAPKTKKDDTEVVVAEPVAKKVIAPDEGLEKLKKQLETEKQARADADRARQEADQRAQQSAESERQARTESQDNQIALVTNAINAVRSSNEALKAKYREARQANDADAEFDIQQSMSENAAKLVQLEAGKAALEKAPKPQPRQAQDPVEQFAGQLSPRSAQWVRSHPEYVRSQSKNSAMIGAHNIAMDRGIAPDSDEYFKFIETSLGLQQPVTNGAAGHAVTKTDDDDDATSEASRPAREQPAPASAPVSRGGNGTGSNPNRVTLTAAEVEMATMMKDANETDAQAIQNYAKNKALLKREGRLN